MRYWTSDPHYYHANVIKYCDRPYKTVEEMNEALVANWNSVVTPDDEVVVVGDFSMAFRSVELFTPRLIGRKLLVAGNHDFCHDAHKKSRTPEKKAEWTKKYLDNGWAEVHDHMQAEIPGIGTVNVSHLPYLEKGESTEDQRHVRHRLMDNGLWLICGHVHEKWKVRNKMLNVGVDVWGYRPISDAEVAGAMLAAGA